MSIGSISSAAVASAYDAVRPAGEQAAPKSEARGIADHVAAADEDAPIRSLSATQGTLVDTYL